MRGLIKIRDRRRLEQLSCHCYRNIRLKRDSLFQARSLRLPLLGLSLVFLAAE
jgi:hypothetical protein